MGLINKFNNLADAIRSRHEAAKAARTEKRRAYVNRQLEELAALLPQSIEQARLQRRNSTAFFIRHLRSDDIKMFAGYKALHKVCAAADVRIEKEKRDIAPLNGTLTMTGGEYIQDAIVIRVNQPYNASSHAGLFTATQLKFPGL